MHALVDGDQEHGDSAIAGDGDRVETASQKAGVQKWWLVQGFHTAQACPRLHACLCSSMIVCPGMPVSFQSSTPVPPPPPLPKRVEQGATRQ